jgi:peptidoglycan/xylan/chitin deacetylase (PgdA/CDA1 family)
LDAPLAERQPLVIPLFAGIEPSGPFDVQGVEIARGLGERRVALTLDAGASSVPASRILDTLREYDVQITFFLTGRFVEQNPELVQRMAAEGHEFANHTYSHPDLRELGDEAIREELNRTENLIQNLSGQSTRPYMRPPFGARNQRVLDLMAQEGYISIYWTVDSWDSVGEPKTPEFLLQRVTHPTDSYGNPIPLNGAIVLMHVGSEPTADALPDILKWFRQEGWEIVPISEILRPPTEHE